MAHPSKISKSVGLALACLVSIAVVPVMLSAGGPDSGELERRRERVEAMSKVERDQLRHNFEVYQGLSEEQRTRCRKLHQAVASDSDLKATMENYLEWLKTLSPWKREELRKEKDPEKRMKLIRQFKQDQDEKRDERSEWYRGGRGRWGYVPKLDSDEFAALTDKIEAHLQLPPHKQRELDFLKGFERHVKVVRALLFLPSEVSQVDGLRVRQLPDELVNRLIQAVPNDRDRRILESKPEGDHRRGTFIGMLFRSLFAEAWNEFERNPPTDDELHEYFMSLEGEPRDELMRAPANEAKSKLLWKYFHEKSYGRQIHSLSRSLWNSRSMGGGQRPSGPRDEGRIDRKSRPFSSGTGGR